MAKIGYKEVAAKFPTLEKGADIVHNYKWTISQMSPEALAEIPIIHLVEYQQTVSGLAQQINYWALQAQGVIRDLAAWDNSQDPYKGLYVADATGAEFVFPFLENYHHTVTNNWGDNKGPLGEFVQNVIVPAAKVLKPNAGIEPPKAWEGSSAVSYTFKFQLLNTVDGDWEKNKTFINRMIMANLQNRLNSVASEPPVFYSIDIPGVRFAPVAVISNFTVSNEGQLNNIKGQLIPDAYQLTFNITELISESRQIFDGVVTGSKITSVIVGEGANAFSAGFGENSITGLKQAEKGFQNILPTDNSNGTPQ